MMNTSNSDHIDILLAANAGLIPELGPSEASRKRMLASIQQQIVTPSMRVVRRAEGQWHDIFPGVSIKVLQQNHDEQTQTTLWRLQAGAIVPRHQHSLDEECLVLEGSILHAGIEYFSGDYLLSPKGMPHDEFSAPNGALFLIRGEPLSHEMIL
jgi:anti-sigma factor ChrR (cupin superfamily)